MDLSQKMESEGMIMDMRFRFRTIIYIVTSTAVLLAVTGIGYLLNLNSFIEKFIDINYFDLLVGQVANTLIVLSLTSVLSSNFGQAYWMDIKDTKLITPFWGCFIGITVYLLTGLVYSVVAYVLRWNIGVVISALFSTILLIVLTFKMISIYFGKEDLKKQLAVEYKQLLILTNSSYITDYLRRIKSYLIEIEEKEFSGKSQYIRKLKKEIQSIEDELNSGNDELIDTAHKKHIDKYMSGLSRLQSIDMKIVEYTQNAIDNNETEVVRENIGLLVECENYEAFFNLIEELFDWDEKYACRTLRELSEKNMAWVMKDKMSFFKQYALQKLIAQSGKLDALQNLLLIYDVTNEGMNTLQPRLKKISERCHELKIKELEISREISDMEDFRESMRKERELREAKKLEEEQLREDILSVLESATTKELRAFYIPIREAVIAYDEGKYEIANKFLTVILANYNQDLQYIKSTSGLMEIDKRTEFTFSYVTEEEVRLIDQLIEKDKEKQVLSEKDKKILSKMDKVTISNHPMSDVDEDTLEIFRATLDIPKAEN